MNRHWHFKQEKNPTKSLIKNMFGGRVRFWGGDDEEQSKVVSEPKFYQQPEYPEATAARTNWAKALTDWQNSGSYGANLPNYEDIFQKAKNRISQYYWGSPTSPGVIDRLKSSVAQRGVQDSPALGVLTSRMGAQEATEIGDRSTAIDTEKANAIESARNNWLSSLMNLSNMKPSGSWGGTQTTYAPSTSAMDVLGTILGGGMGLAGNYLTGYGTGKGQSAGLKSIFDLINPSGGSGMPTSLDNPYGENYGQKTDFDWTDMVDTGVKALPYLAMLA